MIGYVENNLDSNVHVIVSTINEGRKVYDKLKRSMDERCAFIYSGSEEQEVIAKKWNENEIQVLISTSLGLVGNESSKTQLVCIIGLLYNLPSIVQAMGRIRPARRTENSTCMIFTAEHNFEKIQVSKVDSLNAFNELVGCKIMSIDTKIQYFRSMSLGSVNNWLFDDTGCRMVSLGKRLGFTQNICKVCDICTNTNVKRSSISKQLLMDKQICEKELGIQLLQRFRFKCICCNNSFCTGICVVKKMGRGLNCYHCLGNHRSSECSIYKPILKGKACFSCYQFNYSQQSVHIYTACNEDGQIRERLRALIQNDFLQKRTQKRRSGETYSFQEHLSGIYANVDTYFRFLHKYKDWK